MMRSLVVIACFFLAACGVDGEPVRPNVNAGVNINKNGIYPSASVGVAKGPLSIGLGL